MKKFLFFMVAGLVCTGMLTSCKDKNVPADAEQQKHVSIFTKEDTTKVRELAEQFANYLKSGDLKAATEMLSYLKGDSVTAYKSEDMKRQAFALGIMAKKPAYEVEYIKMRDVIDNEIKINITLFEKKEDDPRPNTMAFVLRPVRINGQWYLTTRDNLSDTHSELRNKHANE